MTDPSGESDRRFPWPIFISELIGTAFLVGVGLSIVIFMFGEGTPMAGLIPSEFPSENAWFATFCRADGT